MTNTAKTTTPQASLHVLLDTGPGRAAAPPVVRAGACTATSCCCQHFGHMMRLAAGAHLQAASVLASAELPRRDAGFNPDVRTIWLAEGLVNYIPEAGLRTLLSSVAEVRALDHP